jgi:nitrogen regulatory protein PII
MLRMKFRNVLLSALFLFCSAASADDAILKPFVLASKGEGTLVEKSAQVKTELTTAGFTVVGEYAPYAGADIVVVTNDELKKNAAASDFGGYGAIQRVSITEVGKEVQVSYTNPVYMANVYRMKDDLHGVAAALATALGKVEEFGAQGMTAKQARKYHYTIGMEYFNEPSVLAEYGSYEEAVQAVDTKLAHNKNGVSKVFRVDIPGKQESVFGVGMKGSGDDKSMDDQYIMKEIDFRDVKSTAHLPYEVLVSGNKVYALYARFRIAINFPDLSMMGSHSFMNIMKAPEAIRHALQDTVQK